MCRLFGMTGGRTPVTATFWLLDAADSLAAQSHREPDGTGLGGYHEPGKPFVSRQPIAAYEDAEFSREARELRSRTFIAHIRYASNGGVAPENTHPFEQARRLFAHNGVIQQTERLDEHLGAYTSLVHGETDSERFFALITKGIDEGMSVDESIAEAARWIAGNLPVFALNLILITGSDLWALRYPDTHELHVLERQAGGPSGEEHLDHSGASPQEIHVHSAHLAEHPALVVASEPMDDDPGWQALESGELLHVDADLGIERRIVLTEPPAHPLTLADLDPRAASSQRGA